MLIRNEKVFIFLYFPIPGVVFSFFFFSSYTIKKNYCSLYVDTNLRKKVLKNSNKKQRFDKRLEHENRLREYDIWMKMKRPIKKKQKKQNKTERKENRTLNITLIIFSAIAMIPSDDNDDDDNGHNYHS